MIFLSHNRRAELIQSLTNLSMPKAMAEQCASYTDDLIGLDKLLAGVVARLGERSDRLTQAAERGDEQRRRNYAAFFEADLIVFSTYRAEILSRRLPPLTFPLTSRAVDASVNAIQKNKSVILKALCKHGYVH